MVNVIVEINNSYSRVKGLGADQFNALRKTLSYEENAQAAYFSRKSFRHRYYLIDKKGYFPTGLLGRVNRHLAETSVKASRIDLRVKPRLSLNETVKTTYKPKLAQSEACDSTLINERGGIVMPTGSGKSLVIALIAGRLNCNTLVVVPNLEIKKQLTETLDFQLGKNKVTVQNIDGNFDFKAKFDCLIIDECHHAAAKTYQKLNKLHWSDIYYRYFLTATYFRNQSEDQMLFEGIVGDIIYNLSYKRAVDLKMIVPVEAYYYEVPKKVVNGYTWGEVYKELVVNNEIRNDMIAAILLRLNKSNIPTLCLVKEIAHGNILSDLTNIPFANGQDETSRSYIQQLNEGKIKALIGTAGILGEGVDTKPCEFVIIAGLGKAKSAFMQQVGRAVRVTGIKESAKVIIFKDKSHKFTKSHFKTQSEILLDEYGISPVELF